MQRGTMENEKDLSGEKMVKSKQSILQFIELYQFYFISSDNYNTIMWDVNMRWSRVKLFILFCNFSLSLRLFQNKKLESCTQPLHTSIGIKSQVPCDLVFRYHFTSSLIFLTLLAVVTLASFVSHTKNKHKTTSGPSYFLVLCLKHSSPTYLHGCLS